MFKYIDLFAGAGGLSEGFIRENFMPIAHVEKDKYACETLKTRLAFHYLKKISNLESYYDYLRKKITRAELHNLIPQTLLQSVICSEISDNSFADIVTKIDKQEIDVIVGGPPCQAYSIVGRARVRDEDKKNNDPRRFLYKQYIKFLEVYKPKLFVFENVPGILSAKDTDSELFIKKMKTEFEEVGYTIDFELLDASNFGVLQKRKRVIIIGWQSALNLRYPDFSIGTIDNSTFEVKRDILDDLPNISQGESWNKFTYRTTPTAYLNSFGIRTEEDVLTWHIARPTNSNDRQIYKLVIEKWFREHKRLHYKDLPEDLKTQKNQNVFNNRFSVVEGDLPFAHTVVAHIEQDGHYYIYPDINQLRSITVREAARIQSFPDNYFFEGTRSAAFRQIGNAVAPIFARVVAIKIKEMLWQINSNQYLLKNIESDLLQDTY
ncbi:DNA cytosine methyltransferase [Emticicia sp. 17c]|uniref:DNA cytosine methyltransferase n=1 Tax=Emticicia sp. 17c TaxID=3127704 RepID=UPI00301C1E76